MNKKEKMKNKNVGVALLGDPKKLKQQKGITLIAVIVTVIVMLILASTGIYVGMDTVEHSRVVKFVSYMQVIQRKVDELASNSNTIALGKTLSESGKQSEIEQVLTAANQKGEIQTVNVEDYRYFNQTDLVEEWDLSNIEDEIVINFKTREVVSLTGIEYNKNSYSGMYYTQYLLPTGQQIIKESSPIERTKTFSIDKNIDGLTATININNISITNATLSFKEETGNWNIITNYTTAGKSETIKISKSGKYMFKLTDNSDSTNSGEQSINIVLTNPPILTEGLTYEKEEYDYSGGINSESGAVAKDSEGNLYVWIPRFAYDAENKIKFIRGTSSITTYNEKILDSWKIPNEFTNLEGIGYLESTGIWKAEENIGDLGTNWIYDHATQTVTNGIKTLNVGDYVTYNEPASLGYAGEWRVLGANNEGNILLVSDKNITSQTLSGADGYNNGIDILDGICDEYADGKIAISGRSVNIDDINKITGYISNDEVLEATYKLTSDGLSCEMNGVTSTNSTVTQFLPLGETSVLIADEQNSYSIVSGNPFYTYFVEDYGFGSNNVIREMLFPDGYNNLLDYYWLASTYIAHDIGNKCNYGIFSVAYNWVGQPNEDIGYLWASIGNSDTIGGKDRTMGVRAVVTLSPDVELKFISTDIYTGVSTYNI